MKEVLQYWDTIYIQVLNMTQRVMITETSTAIWYTAKQEHITTNKDMTTKGLIATAMMKMKRDEFGYNIERYDKNNFHENGLHKETGTKFNEDELDVSGYNKHGYDERGFDIIGYNKNTGMYHDEFGVDNMGCDFHKYECDCKITPKQ